MKCRVIVNRNYVIDKIDSRIYSGFIEHLGRAVYEGVYQPEHPLADEDGFRRDVIELVRELNMPLTRYPGGNFVSGYNWEDGVGPREHRPARLDLAWKALEPNLFGTDEFIKWCSKANTAPMMAVNLGTRGAAEAQKLVEYCNFPGRTAISDQRRKNGAEKPHGVKIWCLGNEMDGHWQICHRNADDYGRAALEAAKMMKWTDPTIELVVCGTSGLFLPTLGEWDSTVLEHTYDIVDYLSIHHYFGNLCDLTPGYLAQAEVLSDHIDRAIACCDFVRTRKKSQKKIMLSIEEWNVWFHSYTKKTESPEWSVARPLLEDIYTMEDALLVGMVLMTIINHADRVKIACLAQTVNVIAPIITEKNGKAWRQTIFYPFALTSRYGRGIAMRVVVDSPTYDAEYRWSVDTALENYHEIPYLYCSCVYNTDRGEIVLFAVNRNLNEKLELELNIEDFNLDDIIEHQTINYPDLKAVNSASEEKIHPVKLEGATLENNILKAVLPAASWNMIRIKCAEI